ncbi:hypothetical protein NIES267_17050 [Calothrix parasitica NIES-267]|uniref:Uncharacterized protein n=1 Tax=Calothrix parasitica NIES-267 TaxID=1973488 RepID=A0A1Z4LLY0_9CYAN|nr:hypothetical protein NIES267_17050 [Calothrix parasitica NIES-267]
MNYQKFKKRDYIFLTCQIILLIFALVFASQQKYLQAVVLLVLSGGIGSAVNSHSVIKLFNKINLGLAVLIACYWFYLAVFVQ